MERPLKILLADDSPTVAGLLRRALERKGHQVIVAKDGMEAVEAAYREYPDLLVSDIVMPRLNGYQVCRLLKDDQIFAGLPMVILTSLDAKDEMFWGTQSGADRYLVKTTDVDSLVGELERFMEERRLASRETGRTEAEASEINARSGDTAERVIQLLDQSLFESSVLNMIFGLVNVLGDSTKIVRGVLDILSKVIDFDMGLICLVDDESRKYYLFLNAPVKESFTATAMKLSNEFMLRETPAARLPEEFTLDTCAFGIQRTKTPHEAAAEVGSHYLQLLTTKGHPFGSIGLFSRRQQAFRERILQTKAIGNIWQQASIVIDYARLYERNVQLSITDGLTKVYNQRYFHETLRRDFLKSSRHKEPLSLLLLDLDDFKRVNDTWGHQRGDAILAEVARILKRSVRGEDMISRYGGEEFTVLMPGTAVGDASRVAERLRKSIEEENFPGADEPIKVTVSIGVAAIPHLLICNPVQMVSAADQALYNAKKNGRNRVELHA